MNVSPGHVLFPLYQLWMYLLTKSFAPLWFVKRNRDADWHDEQKTEPKSFIPNSLCPFLNRLVLYFAVQVPAMLIGLGVASFILIYSQIEFFMGWHITGGMDGSFDLVGEFAKVGFAFFCIEIFISIVFACIYARLYLRDSQNRKKKWVQCVNTALESVGDTPTKLVKPILYPWHVLNIWFEARHEKFCPTLTFEVEQEKSTPEKQE